MFDDILREFEVGLKKQGVDYFSVERIAHLAVVKYEARFFTWYGWNDPMRDAKRQSHMSRQQLEQLERELEAVSDAELEREAELEGWLEAIHVTASLCWSAEHDSALMSGSNNLFANTLAVEIGMQSPVVPPVKLDQVQEIVCALRPTFGEHFESPALSSFNVDHHYVFGQLSPKVVSRIARVSQAYLVSLPCLEIYRLRDAFDPTVKAFIADIHTAAGKIAICHRAWEPCARQLIGLPRDH